MEPDPEPEPTPPPEPNEVKLDSGWLKRASAARAVSGTAWPHGAAATNRVGVGRVQGGPALSPAHRGSPKSAKALLGSIPGTDFLVGLGSGSTDVDLDLDRRLGQLDYTALSRHEDGW